MNLRLPLCFLAALSLSPLMFAHAQNPGVVTVANPAIFSQVVAISDVHGELDHARTLLRSAHIINAADHWDAGRTLMVVVGDSIDKGPKSIEVLRLWMRLQSEAESKGGRVIVLLGNHEAEFLANPQNHKTTATQADADALHVPVGDMANPARPLGAFLRGLPVAARVGDWVFCHSGWIPDEPWAQFVDQARTVVAGGKYADPFLSADDSILEKKSGASGKKWWHSKHEVDELERRLDVDGLAGVVMGHQPSALGITDNVGASPDGRIFKVDSGMAPPTGDTGGGDGSGQPYAGHLLLITAPQELIGRSHRVRAVSIAANGERLDVPVSEK